MIYGFRTYIVVALMVFFGAFGVQAASSLSDIKVTNTKQEATVVVSFTGPPEYTFASLRQPERVVIDVKQSGKVSGLPLNFSGQNLLKSVRSSQAKTAGSVRLVLDLTQRAKTRAVVRNNGNTYAVVFTITAENNTVTRPVRETPILAVTEPPKKKVLPSGGTNPFSNNPPLSGNTVSDVAVSNKPVAAGSSERVVVAIDAGHGGQDPGAIGANGLQEKSVTLAIARRLYRLLDADPMFKPVMTRSDDYFISVMGRSDVARKQGANILVSIHADAAPNRSANGASVWVLSNRRANSEMAGWLEQHEKQSELLGGAGDVLANSQADPYLSQAVLDLQFGHSQRVGYDVAVKVLQQLQRVGGLHKRRPEHASLGVLRSPDIPSLLVETGFISNSSEERLLGSAAYQNKLAQALHNGLRSYFKANPLQAAPKAEKSRPKKIAARSNANTASEVTRSEAKNTQAIALSLQGIRCLEEIPYRRLLRVMA